MNTGEYSSIIFTIILMTLSGIIWTWGELTQHLDDRRGCSKPTRPQHID